MKILHFEGAGWSNADISKSTIGNCRIRTAFHLDDGRLVYLEIIGSERTKRSLPEVYKWPYTGFVDSCFYITDEKPNDDENKHRIRLTDKKRVFEYSEKAILKFVNKLGASFDAIKVVPDLGGYRVFKEKYFSHGSARYNYGDEFDYNEEAISRRQIVYNKIYEIEKAELKEDRENHNDKLVHSPGPIDYPNFSLWVDEEDAGVLHLLRHFIGYNKHWIIRTDCGETLDDWMGSMTETALGRYGC